MRSLKERQGKGGGGGPSLLSPPVRSSDDTHEDNHNVEVKKHVFDRPTDRTDPRENYTRCERTWQCFAFLRGVADGRSRHSGRGVWNGTSTCIVLALVRSEDIARLKVEARPLGGFSRLGGGRRARYGSLEATHLRILRVNAPKSTHPHISVAHTPSSCPAGESGQWYRQTDENARNFVRARTQTLVHAHHCAHVCAHTQGIRETERLARPSFCITLEVKPLISLPWYMPSM